VSVIGQDERREDPLLGAICEFRQELIRWIDCQISQCRQREGRLGEPVPGVSAVPPQSSRSDSQLKSEPPTVKPLRDLSDAPSDVAQPGDARDRLDALARQLGERLRLSEAGRRGTETGDKTTAGDERRGTVH
jgi:hypothetical protein